MVQHFPTLLWPPAKGGEWRLVLHGLGQLGSLADEVTYGTAMHAAVLGKAWRQSVALFEKMCLGPTDRDTPHTIPHPCKNWNSRGRIGGMLHFIGAVFFDYGSPNLNFHLNWLFGFLAGFGCVCFYGQYAKGNQCL